MAVSFSVDSQGKRSKFYTLIAAGGKQFAAREKNWEQVVIGVRGIQRFA